MSSLKGLAQEYDEEEDPVRRGMVAQVLVSKILEGPVNDETSVIGVGPVSLDVSMARSHGWSKEQIERAWSALESVSSAEAEISRLRHPELFEDDGEGNEIFVGDESTGAHCSKCGMEFRYYQGHSFAPGVHMLLDASGTHVGYNLAGADYKKHEIVCEVCGSDSGL